MFIEPSTNIRLLKNVPINNSYKDTIYFIDATEQYNYFINFSKYTLNKQTYQRVNKGKARVGIKAESLYDCNYMMFQNESFGTKWFYAFITSVEYINNAVSEISFEIDILQTWLLDCTFKECFVEREHSTTDNIGDNLLPENLDTGEYITDDFSGTGYMKNWKIVVATNYDKNGTEYASCDVGGILHGFIYIWFDNQMQFKEWYDSLTDDAKSDGVHAIIMYPEAFCVDLFDGLVDYFKTYTISKTKQTSSIDGYVPRNKKLFTHPYNFLYVSNLEGLSAEYPYEYFDSAECSFELAGDMSCNPSIILMPLNYRGATNNIDEKLTLSNFPMCSWSTDAFRAWLAQNSGSLVISTGVALGSTIANAYAGNVVGAVNAGVQVANTLANVFDRSRMPRQAHGLGGSSTQIALKIKDFAFMHKHITKQFAMIIDEYFDMYGYATHRVKVPNRSYRPCWNYVKTIGCKIVGGAPADDIARMCKIHDEGITYWKPTAYIGSYNPTFNNNKV